MKNAAIISRIILTLLIIFTLSIFLPRIYWMVFEKSVYPSRVYYSMTDSVFIGTKVDNKSIVYFDNKENKFSREDFERKTPFFSYRQLVFRDEMPDTILGQEVDYQEIRENNIYFSLRPEDVFYYQIELFPLIESKPNQPELTLPIRFFRVTDKFEIFKTNTNTIDTSMSQSFTNALLAEGFQFPAKKYFGNPSTMKPYHEGFFILDNNGELFHLNRIKNEPYCKKIVMPTKLNIKHVLVREMVLKEFHAAVFTEDNRVFLISYDNYKIIELPIKDYNLKTMKLEFKGTLAGRLINLVTENSVSSFAMDRDYNLIDTYELKWKTSREGNAGKVFSYLFPFKFSITNPDNLFANFYFESFGWNFIYLNILLLIIMLLIKSGKSTTISSKIVDTIIVLLTGIYGVIAVLLIKDEN